VSEGGARRELEDVSRVRPSAIARLMAALRSSSSRLAPPSLTTRAFAAWRRREVQTVHSGPRKGERVVGRWVGRHLARFILVAP
jgi:hypothetical protein